MSTALILLLAAAVLSLAFATSAQRARIAGLISENSRLQPFEQMYQTAATDNAKLTERCANLVEKIDFLENTEKRLAETFKSAGQDALVQNSRLFLGLAEKTFEQLREKNKSDMALSTKSFEELVNPVKSALTEVETKLGELEKSRVGAYEAIKQQISDMICTQNFLRAETGRLVSALKTPNVRGRWGEIQLKRVVELAGMTRHCDFGEQVSLSSDGEEVRPDMVISLPGQQHLAVDAKAPLDAYLRAIEESDEQMKKNLLEQHAKRIRSCIRELSEKKYWAKFDRSPQFTIMFLPGEIFFSTAVEQDPLLMEFAIQKQVVISTPMTLLAMLHAVAFGWRRHSLAENAEEIAKVGRELYARLGTMSEHFLNLGKNINSAVSCYNKTLASLESRVLVTARRFKELGIEETKDMAELKPAEQIFRLPGVAESDIREEKISKLQSE
jgi:DNA recombination protein RmuC